MTTVKSKKRQKLRNAEYFDLQSTFDRLYSESKKNKNFSSLMDIVTSDENIMLAYRNISKNKGSKTAGTDGKTIRYLSGFTNTALINYVKRRLSNYQPQSVRRVEIPKGDTGKTRPLGIPTISDRLIQQCFLQVLEPICEAKFHERSNGFRPNRSAENALAQCYAMIQKRDLHYVIDIDIKGFFDNVSHGKLLKQMWSIGIRDKTVLSIISSMLKAEVAGIGFPTKGTPQGGIISPLLSNIVLNELDWWITSQWENMPTRKVREYARSDNGAIDKNQKYEMLRKGSALKECYIVRYADDFKIFCRKRSDADKLFVAVKDWLKERLGLDISPEKSKIVNLRRQYSDFLGFKLKAVRKGSSLLVWVLSFIMILTVYGRFFKLYMYVAISPIPLSTFAGEETSNIGKSFIKSYAGVCLEGAIIVLACIIYSKFATSVPSVDATASAITQVWTYVGELLFNMLVLVGTIKLSDQVVQKMIGV